MAKKINYVQPSMRIRVGFLLIRLAGRLIKQDNRKADYFIHFIGRPKGVLHTFLLPRTGSGSLRKQLIKSMSTQYTYGKKDQRR